MQALMTKLREGCGRHLVVVILVSLALVETLSFAVLARTTLPSDVISSDQPAEESASNQPILKISDIRDSRIDDEAAMVVVKESAPATDGGASACSTLPANIWIFLVMAYVALLVFNFSYTFRQAIAPQWFWETLYTALALVGWYFLDECRTHIWFPFAIAQFGLIVFALYAYLLEKKLLEKTAETEGMF